MFLKNLCVEVKNNFLKINKKNIILIYFLKKHFKKQLF
jgi:hypothetical protein